LDLTVGLSRVELKATEKLQYLDRKDILDDRWDAGGEMLRLICNSMTKKGRNTVAISILLQ